MRSIADNGALITYSSCGLQVFLSTPQSFFSMDFGCDDASHTPRSRARRCSIADPLDKCANRRHISIREGDHDVEREVNNDQIAWAVRQQTGYPAATLALIKLATICDDVGDASIHYEDLGELCGFTRVTAFNSCRHLERREYIRITRSGVGGTRTPSIFRLLHERKTS